MKTLLDLAPLTTPGNVVVRGPNGAILGSIDINSLSPNEFSNMLTEWANTMRAAYEKANEASARRAILAEDLT